jgi:ubiquinone/menaquinone biosynthesis C-methylase UbiE
LLNINYATVIDPILRNARERLPEFSGMHAGDRVMDVCCGSGAQVNEYLRKGIIALGVDIDPHMLDLAERYYPHSDMATSTFILADASHLPFNDASFDFTSVSLALHDKDFKLVDAIVSEMKRVTCPGGFLVFMDYSMPLPRSLTGSLIRAVERMAGVEHFRNFRGFLNNGGLTRVLEKNGLMMVKSIRVSSGNITLVLAQNSSVVTAAYSSV